MSTPPAKRSRSSKTVSEGNLVALGVERLAAILMESADGDPALKRRLRMELAGEVGGEHLAAEIAKRLATVERRRSRIHWRKYKAFVRDLDLQRTMIAGPLAALDPKLALEFLWRFLAMAQGVFRQTDDKRGEVALVFRAAVADLGTVVALAKTDVAALAGHVVAALEDDDDGLFDDLVAAIAPSLDEAGVAVLRDRVQRALDARAKRPAGLRAAVQHLADLQGDVDGYISVLSATEQKQPLGGAEMARRLLAVGRTEEALAALARSAPPPPGRVLLPGVLAWEDVYLSALDADGQGKLAQELRWAAFERRLAPERLRAFLKKLPDFDDVEAEDRALAYARTFPQFTDALRFLTQWPAPAIAADLVLGRSGDIDPHKTEVLEAAAQVLEARHPLAASVLLRAMVADTVRWTRADRAKDAERQLDDLEALAIHVPDWGDFGSHDAFVTRVASLRRR